MPRIDDTCKQYYRVLNSRMQTLPPYSAAPRNNARLAVSAAAAARILRHHSHDLEATRMPDDD